MSMDRCDYCGWLVDTDDDTDCYLPDPRMSLRDFPDICVCERCRGKMEEDDRYQGPESPL
jgi:hypothetical protein